MTRLDAALVTRGLARSRAQARELIEAGGVRVDGEPAAKPALRVGADTPIEVLTPPEPWVGRAAHKLLEALRLWGPSASAIHHDPVPDAIAGMPPGECLDRVLDPRGLDCLDVGASTGGFTQVLLAAGARAVTALDVGHGQLVEELRNDGRVRDLPGTNIRDVGSADLATDEHDGRFDLVVADLSFISLTLVLSAMAACTTPTGDLVVLLKPQFEVGRERLARTGVVTSPHEHRRVIRQVLGAADRAGLSVVAAAPSPIKGSEGNTEFLLWLTPDAGVQALSPEQVLGDMLGTMPPSQTADNTPEDDR